MELNTSQLISLAISVATAYGAYKAFSAKTEAIMSRMEARLHEHDLILREQTKEISSISAKLEGLNK